MQKLTLKIGRGGEPLELPLSFELLGGVLFMTVLGRRWRLPNEDNDELIEFGEGQTFLPFDRDSGDPRFEYEGDDVFIVSDGRRVLKSLNLPKDWNQLVEGYEVILGCDSKGIILYHRRDRAPHEVAGWRVDIEKVDEVGDR